MNWELFRQAFEPDGALRDLYVLNTDERDWDCLLTLLQASPSRLEFTLGGAPAVLPVHVSEIFRRRPDVPSPMLVIDPAGLGLHCHFFDPSEIEFDLDPRTVTEPLHLARLFQFMHGVADLLGKAILLTPENQAEYPWFRIEPGQETESFVPDEAAKH